MMQLTELFENYHSCIFDVHFCTERANMEWNDVRILLAVARYVSLDEAARTLGCVIRP